MHFLLMQIESDKSSRWLIRRRVWPQSAAYAGAPPRPTFTTVKATDFVFFLRFFPLIFSAMLIFVIDISRCGQLLLLQSLLQKGPAQTDQVSENMLSSCLQTLLSGLIGSCPPWDLTFLLRCFDDDKLILSYLETFNFQ